MSTDHVVIHDGTVRPFGFECLNCGSTMPLGMPIATSDLVRAMEQAITAGAKTIIVGSQASRNRVSSQALERKNVLNVLSALRTVVTQNTGNASKQTERADKAEARITELRKRVAELERDLKGAQIGRAHV